MSISTTKRRNEEVNVGISDRRKAEITAPTFDLFGETYTFVKTFSGTVINSNPSNNQIWVKPTQGMRSRFPTMVSPSEVHTLFINTSCASIVRMVRITCIKMHLSLIRTRENMK